METMTYTTTRGTLTINGTEVSIQTKFDEIFRGRLYENGKLVCKSGLALSLLSNAMNEIR